MTAPSGRHPGLDPGSIFLSLLRALKRRWIPAFAGMTMLWAAPLAAQTFVISGGTVALGDGSEPIPNGQVVIRDGRVVAAGNVRMKLPAGAQPGQKFRLKGRGLPTGPSTRGDFLVEVHPTLPKTLSEQERTHWEALSRIE